MEIVSKVEKFNSESEIARSIVPVTTINVLESGITDGILINTKLSTINRIRKLRGLNLRISWCEWGMGGKWTFNPWLSSTRRNTDGW